MLTSSRPHMFIQSVLSSQNLSVLSQQCFHVPQVQCVSEVVLRAAADLPEVPAGRVAEASCSPGCRVLDSAQEAADTPLHDPVLQPAQSYNKIAHRCTSYIVMKYTL